MHKLLRIFEILWMLATDVIEKLRGNIHGNELYSFFNLLSAEIVDSPFGKGIRLYSVKPHAIVEKIVVGMPVNMDGSRGFRCDECLELGRLLGEKTGLEIAYEDERLTTVIAHDVLSANNVRGKKRKQSVDAVAAVLILQSGIPIGRTRISHHSLRPVIHR